MSNITVPYSVNAINGHSGSMTRGTYNFTTTITLKKVQPTYLWFQHADQSADIYVDDVKVTTHWGGYNAFFTDITNYVHIGVNNIKVALCNVTRNTLAPSAGDFNFNATLGKVQVWSSPVLPSMDYGYDGFHVKATNISSASATLTIKTNVPVGATLLCKVDDNVNNTKVNKYYEKKPSTGNEVTFTTTISNPTLWDGLANPHLYTVTLEIYKDGDLYHKFERDYGIRYYDYVFNESGYVDGQTYTGFLLNGHPYKLRGVCMHNDIVNKANALSDEDTAHDFEIIQELGCNFIRLAHYPHPKEVYDWCDKLGIIVQTEVPCVNVFNTSAPQDYYDHLDIQYTDMVRQHFNHPCIVFWGLFNEAGSPGDTSWAKTKLEYYRTLIKNIDPERWVGYVAPQGQSNPSSYMGNPDMDWYGCNIYVGWYTNNGQNSGTLSNNPTSALTTRCNNIIVSKQKPLAYSEYGCGGVQRCHSDNFTDTTDRGNKPRHDIEYQMWLHEGHLAAIRNFPQLLFTSQWQLFDIAVAGRTEGYKVCLNGVDVYDDESLKRLNNKGLVERDHVTKKDTFYLYKAEWNPTPFVHICGKNYEKLENRVIKCYTNESGTFSLYVNNSAEAIATATMSNNIVLFDAKTFHPGDVVRVDGPTTTDSFTVRDYSQEYLTFFITKGGNIKWKSTDSSSSRKTISYSINGGDWTDITSATGGTAFNVSESDVVRFKGTNETYGTSSSSYSYFNGGTANFTVYGNIMSLVYGDNFANQTTMSSAYTFTNLFNGSTTLMSSQNLILPSTTLTEGCYSAMFKGCNKMTTPPVLKATSLANADSCYESMFENCTSLVRTPVLPATTISDGCYKNMFSTCTALTAAPALSATTVGESSYEYMFAGCTGLTTPPALPATTLDDSCYLGMFQDCTSLTTTPALPASTLSNSCYHNMFYGCVSLTTVQTMSATTLATQCYYGMFEECTSLTTPPALPITILASNCYAEMFANCTSLTTAPELPATTLGDYCYYNMFSGCSSLNYIKCLATDKSASHCTTYWVEGVADTGTFVKHPTMTDWTTGVSGIPSGWTVQNA